MCEPASVERRGGYSPSQPSPPEEKAVVRTELPPDPELVTEPPEYLEPISAGLENQTEGGRPPEPELMQEQYLSPHQDEVETLPEEDADGNTTTGKTDISGQWRCFVDAVAKNANVTLISLLRNAVVLELNEQQLVIGYQNIQVFTEDKRAQIAETARSFFNNNIRVVFRESGDGLDDSLKKKHDIAQAKADEEIRQIARKDKVVTEVLAVFPEAEIKDITILDEKADQ